MLLSKIIHCHCFLFSKKLQELGVETEDTKAKFSFEIDQLIAVHEWGDNNQVDIDNEKCMIYLSFGDSFLIDRPFKEMNEILKNKYIVTVSI